MKRSKRLPVLAAVLVVACAATFALTRYEEKQEQIRAGGTTILALSPDDVESLSWDYAEDDGLAFHREGETWHYDEDEAFPVSEDRVASILTHLQSLQAAFTIEAVEDYGQYGLSDPECTIRVTAAGEDYSIRLGDFSKMDEQRYVDIGDGNVYLVGDDLMDCVTSKLSELIRHDALPEFTDVSEITFSGSETYSIVKLENSPDTYDSENDIYFTQQDGRNAPLDSEKVSDYLEAVTDLSLLSYVTYNATQEELERYGLETPELSAEIRYTETDENGDEVSESCVIHIGRNAEEWEAYKAAEEAGEALPSVTRYVRVGDSQIVYRLNSSDYTALSAVSCDDLRHEEVFWGDFDLVTQIELTLENETHTLVTGEDEDGKTAWYYGEEKLDLDELQAALEDLRAERFTDETPSGKEEIGLILRLENENFPQVEIRLYRCDGSLCLAQVDGESVSMVERSAVIRLVEAVQAIVLN